MGVGWWWLGRPARVLHPRAYPSGLPWTIVRATSSESSASSSVEGGVEEEVERVGELAEPVAAPAGDDMAEQVHEVQLAGGGVGDRHGVDVVGVDVVPADDVVEARDVRLSPPEQERPERPVFGGAGRAGGGRPHGDDGIATE